MMGTDQNNNGAVAHSRNIIEAHHLRKSFGSVLALYDVSLSIPAGQTVAIMGPSGSGKSTLLHCLSGVLTPENGEVLLGGKPFSKLADKKRSHIRLGHCGFVFQDGQLLEELTARENVALPLMLNGVSRTDALARADEMLVRLGLANERKRRPGDISGGQSQRVAIARALVLRPAVIFADEPTGALDQTTGHEVMQVLLATVKQAGSSLLVVTHDPNVASWCERLIEIRDGMLHDDRFLRGDRRMAQYAQQQGHQLGCSPAQYAGQPQFAQTQQGQFSQQANGAPQQAQYLQRQAPYSQNNAQWQHQTQVGQNNGQVGQNPAQFGQSPQFVQNPQYAGQQYSQNQQQCVQHDSAQFGTPTSVQER